MYIFFFLQNELDTNELIPKKNKYCAFSFSFHIPNNTTLMSYSFISEIEKRQHVMKKALTTKNRYWMMDRNDKNSYNHFVTMQETFTNQAKQASLSKTLAEHLIRIYDLFLEKLQELYLKLSEYRFDSHDFVGIYHDCPSLEWCKEIKHLLQNVMEFPFHQVFLNKTLFARPAHKYNYGLINNDLDSSNDTDVNEINPNDLSFFTSSKVPHIFHDSTFLFSFTFNAYSSTILSTFTPENVLVQNINSSFKSIYCRNVQNILTEQWTISNCDNSLPGILLKYSSNHYPTAYVWKMLDPILFCEVMSNNLNQTINPHIKSKNNTNIQNLIQFIQLILTWIQGIEQNKQIIVNELSIIKSVIQSTQLNLEFAESQIQLLSCINDDELISQIESGNVIKSQLDKLPVISKLNNIFTAKEMRKFTCTS